MRPLVLLLLPALLFGYAIEPQYVNLKHFGPLATEGWNTRSLELISDYT